MTDLLVAGVDVGTRFTRAVVLDAGRRTRAEATLSTGFRLAAAGRDALAKACASGALSRRDLRLVVGTGFGRHQLRERDLTVTELTAHALGARHLEPRTERVLDVGGQTIEAILLDARGRPAAYRLNDACAAGSGAFLERTARFLGGDLATLDAAACHEAPVPISSVCAVFAEAEVINHLSAGVPGGSVLAGVVASIAARAAQLLGRVPGGGPCTATGGTVALASMARALEAAVPGPLLVPERAPFAGAIGAALFGLLRLEERAGDAPPARRPAARSRPRAAAPTGTRARRGEWRA